MNSFKNTTGLSRKKLLRFWGKKIKEV